MAKIYYVDGSEIDVTPKNGTDFQWKELQEIVDGFIEIVYFRDGRMMVVNEEGKLRGLPYNAKATAIYEKEFGMGEFIVGNAIVCDKGQIK